MPYFREIPIKTILIHHFLLGLATGWFFIQGIKLALGRCVFGGMQMTAFFYRLLGVQLSFLVFFIVWIVDQFYWKKHRTATPEAKPTKSEYGKLCLTLLVYAAGVAIINLVRLF